MNHATLGVAHWLLNHAAFFHAGFFGFHLLGLLTLMLLHCALGLVRLFAAVFFNHCHVKFPCLGWLR